NCKLSKYRRFDGFLIYSDCIQLAQSGISTSTFAPFLKRLNALIFIFYRNILPLVSMNGIHTKSSSFQFNSITLTHTTSENVSSISSFYFLNLFFLNRSHRLTSLNN